jgi:pyrroloquinoline quinone biosynthesis protein B
MSFLIAGPRRSALFIPDIDKWARWEQNINQWIAQVDYALLDATFYDAAEIGYRDLTEIPHPFVVESMARFDSLPDSLRQRFFFLHFNHTNPLLDRSSPAFRRVRAKGYRVAQTGMRLAL